jgi:uncharacterized protein (TIGR03066 family)
MRLIALTALALASFATAAVPDDPPKKKPAELLVGEWKLVESSNGTPDDVTFFVTFTKEGEMTLRIEPKDKTQQTVTLKGKYKLKGDDKIDYEMDDGSGGKKTEVLTIKKLTEDDLVTTDPEDVKETFKRVKPKKEPEKK